MTAAAPTNHDRVGSTFAPNCLDDRLRGVTPADVKPNVGCAKAFGAKLSSVQDLHRSCFEPFTDTAFDVHEFTDFPKDFRGQSE